MGGVPRRPMQHRRFGSLRRPGRAGEISCRRHGLARPGCLPRRSPTGGGLLSCRGQGALSSRAACQPPAAPIGPQSPPRRGFPPERERSSPKIPSVSIPRPQAQGTDPPAATAPALLRASRERAGGRRSPPSGAAPPGRFSPPPQRGGLSPPRSTAPSSRAVCQPPDRTPPGPVPPPPLWGGWGAPPPAPSPPRRRGKPFCPVFPRAPPFPAARRPSGAGAGPGGASRPPPGRPAPPKRPPGQAGFETQTPGGPAPPAAVSRRRPAVPGQIVPAPCWPLLRDREVLPSTPGSYCRFFLIPGPGCP